MALHSHTVVSTPYTINREIHPYLINLPGLKEGDHAALSDWRGRQMVKEKAKEKTKIIQQGVSRPTIE